MKRLSKTLAAAGIASRRGCEKLIFEGKVTVNGKVVLIPQTHVDITQDDIRFEDQRIHAEQNKVYYTLNKPRNVICSNQRLGRKKLVIDLFPQEKRLFSVGRLDRDTTGLLIVTNDGDFAQRVIHPRANLEKEYLVKTKQEITHDHLTSMSKGIYIDGVLVRPVRLVKVRRNVVKVIVKEGKKHEVRLLVAKAGLSLLSLHRIRIDSLFLGKLSEGSFREMSEKEKEAIFKN